MLVTGFAAHSFYLILHTVEMDLLMSPCFCWSLLHICSFAQSDEAYIVLWFHLVMVLHKGILWLQMLLMFLMLMVFWLWWWRHMVLGFWYEDCKGWTPFLPHQWSWIWKSLFMSCWCDSYLQSMCMTCFTSSEDIIESLQGTIATEVVNSLFRKN